MINNSYFRPTSVNGKIDLFDILNSSNKIIKKEKNSFHDIIKRDKSSIFKMYSNNYFFKDITANVKKPKGYSSYDIFKGAIKKKNYIMSIIDLIKLQHQKLNELKKQQKHRIKKHYEFEEIELIKRKKIKLEKKYELLKKPLNIKNNSFFINSARVNGISNKMEEKINSAKQNSNIRVRKINLKHKDNIKSFTTTSKEDKIIKLNNLLDKCKIGIRKGTNLEKNFEKFYKKIKKEKAKANKDDKKENIIINILNDNKNRGIDEADLIEKYRILEELKMKELKNEMNLKISDLYAYSNRSEFEKKVNNPKIIKAYELFIEDLNSLHKENDIKRKIERDNISKIKNLLDGFIAEKELLRQRINRFSDRENFNKKFLEKYQFNLEENENIFKDFDKLKDFIKNKTKINVIDKLI